jgi:LPXTG-motif cell wall-anchored protein
MSKNVKIIIIVAIAALVIGLIIFFYKRKKKAEAAAKADAEAAAKPTGAKTPQIAAMVKPNPVNVVAARTVALSGMN